MRLNLYWKDIQQNSYLLGSLCKQDGMYYFRIKEEGLKKATQKGCFGIGELNLFYQEHKSDTLFEFFKRRIPSKDSYGIEQILEELNIKEYNEMELLEKTKGILDTDRYYLEKED